MFIRKVLFWLVVLFGLLGLKPLQAQMLYGNRFNDQLYKRARIQYTAPSGFLIDTTIPNFKFDFFKEESSILRFGYWYSASLADTSGRILFYATEDTDNKNRRVLIDRNGLVSGGRDIAPCNECKGPRAYPTQPLGGAIVPFWGKHVVLTQAYDTSLFMLPGGGNNASYLNSRGIWVAIVGDSAAGYHKIDTVFNIYSLKPIRTPNLQIVKHANGRDYWLFFIDIYEGKWKKALLDPTFTFPISDASTEFFGISPALNMKAITPPATSYQGEHVALYSSMYDSIYIFDIDRCTGNITHNFSFRNPMNGKKVGYVEAGFNWSFTFMENKRLMILIDNKSRTGVFRLNFDKKNVELLALCDSAFFSSMNKEKWVKIKPTPPPPSPDSVLIKIPFYPGSYHLLPDGRVYLFLAYPAYYGSVGLPFNVPYFEAVGDTIRYVYPGIAVNNLYQSTRVNPWFDTAPLQTMYNPVLGPLKGSACDTVTQFEPPPPPPPPIPLQLFPNPPVNGWVYLQGLPEGSKPLLHLTDMLGRTVATLEAANYSNGNYSFNTQNLPAGVYTASLVYPPTNLLPTKLVVVE